MNELEREFTQIVREYKDTIYMVCYMFSKDSAEVEDLYQEVLISLWKSYPSFEKRSSLRTWIWRVSLNTCISIDRKKRRRKDSLPLKMDIDLYTDTDSDTEQEITMHQLAINPNLHSRRVIFEETLDATLSIEMTATTT